MSISTDGLHWQPLKPSKEPFSLYWTGEKLFKYGRGDLEFVFPPTGVRFFKIQLTGEDPAFFWSIHEIEVYGNPERS